MFYPWEHDSLYYCVENGFLYTRETLFQEWKEFKQTGDTDTETFSDYMNNCLSKNGALEYADNYLNWLKEQGNDTDDAETAAYWFECFAELFDMARDFIEHERKRKE